MLATPQMQSALEKASPGDLVQLSDQAMQLQEVGLMFGSTAGTQSNGGNPLSDSLFSALSPNSSTTQTNPLLQALDSSLGITGANSATSSTAGSATTSPSLADQIASSFQAQALDALFNSTQPADPSLNTLG